MEQEQKSKRKQHTGTDQKRIEIWQEQSSKKLTRKKQGMGTQ